MRDDFGVKVVCKISKMGYHYLVLYRYTGSHKYIFPEFKKYKCNINYV